MKTLIILLMVCNNPSTVIVKEPGKPVIYRNYQGILQDTTAQQYLIDILKNPHEELRLDVTQGTCL